MKKKGTGLAALVAILAIGMALVFSGCENDTGLKIATYTVNVSSSIENGDIMASPNRAVEGATVTLIITPDDDYALKSGSLTATAIDGAAQKIDDVDVEEGIYSFIMPAADVTINGEFIVAGTEPIPYNIKISDTITNGSITANESVAEAGDTVTLTIQAASNYRLQEGSIRVVSDNGGWNRVTGIGTQRTFTMPADNVTVWATFEVDDAPRYLITVNSVTGGTITANPAQAVVNETVTLTIEPDAGYQLVPGTLSVVKEDGSPVTVNGSEDTYTFLMPATDVTVSAVFEQIPLETLYEINIVVTNQEAGSITASPDKAAEGATITLIVNAESGYGIGSLTVKETESGAAVSTYNSQTRTFTMPAADVTVTGTFDELGDPFEIEVAETTNGTITVDPSTEAQEGQDVTLTIEPDPGYRLKIGSLKVTDSTGATVIEGISTFFVMPGHDVIVSAEFEPLSAAITINFSPNILNETINLTASHSTISKSQATSLTINVPVGDTVLGWYLNGVSRNSTDSSHTITIGNLVIGKHEVMVIVNRGGSAVPYSNRVIFEVVR